MRIGFVTVVLSICGCQAGNFITQFSTQSPKVSANTFSKKVRATLQKYDKYAFPDPEHRTLVHITLNISNVAMDMQKFTMKSDMILSMTWHDPRLAVRGSGGQKIKLNSHFVQQVWSPEVQIMNREYITRPDALSSGQYVTVRGNGQITLDQRLTVGTRCPGLRRFAWHDHRRSCVCEIHIETPQYSKEFVHLIWTQPAIHFEEGSRASNVQGFKIGDVALSDCTNDYEIGSRSCLQAGIKFRRVSQKEKARKAQRRLPRPPDFLRAAHGLS